MIFDDCCKEYLMLICLMKVFYDAGIDCFCKRNKNEAVNDMDYYYEFIMDAIQNAAPIVESSEKLYKKYGCDEDDGEVNIWAYSSKEMQKYFKIARKLYRLEGCHEKKNPYIEKMYAKAEEIRGFESYCVDYFFSNLSKKNPQLEVIWNCYFTGEVVLCLWIVRLMNLFKTELPIIQEEYRKARRLKKIGKKAGVLNAA